MELSQQPDVARIIVSDGTGTKVFDPFTVAGILLSLKEHSFSGSLEINLEAGEATVVRLVPHDGIWPDPEKEATTPKPDQGGNDAAPEGGGQS